MNNTENDSAKRLDAFEKMLASVTAQYNDTVTKMKLLKDGGREQSVTYKQLLSNKLMLGNIVSMYKLYGLID